jgi:hypothetical protein
VRAVVADVPLADVSGRRTPPDRPGRPAMSVVGATVRAMSDCPDGSAVVELRQYTLRPGQREVLIELFDRELVDSQDAVGMRIIGQFRDLDDPDRFVWLRGFAAMDGRRAGLTRFYGGPVWAEHKAAANATMIDSDNVLLLRPVTRGGGFPALPARPAVGSPVPATLIAGTVFPLPSAGDEQEFLDFLHDHVDPLLEQPGRRSLTELRTEPAVNNFPALPVRSGEHVVVRFSAFDSPDDHASYQHRLRDLPLWREKVRPELDARLAGPPQRLRLRPTARSRLR